MTAVSNFNLWLMRIRICNHFLTCLCFYANGSMKFSQLSSQWGLETKRLRHSLNVCIHVLLRLSQLFAANLNSLQQFQSLRGTGKKVLATMKDLITVRVMNLTSLSLCSVFSKWESTLKMICKLLSTKSSNSTWSLCVRSKSHTNWSPQAPTVCGAWTIISTSPSFSERANFADLTDICRKAFTKMQLCGNLMIICTLDALSSLRVWRKDARFLRAHRC
jgi:hypothetical protein